MEVDVSHNACAVAADGSIVAIGGKDGVVRIWNTETNTVRDVGLRHPGAVLSCAFDPNDSFLVTSGGDGRVIVWDLARRRRRWTLDGHAGWVRACAVAPDGRWLPESQAVTGSVSSAWPVFIDMASDRSLKPLDDPIAK
jgi:WD40 repeat protein